MAPEIGGKRVEYFHCGDLKSLNTNGGLKGPNGRDICIYCLCPKDRYASVQKVSILRNSAYVHMNIRVHMHMHIPPEA